MIGIIFISLKFQFLFVSIASSAYLFVFSEYVLDIFFVEGTAISMKIPLLLDLSTNVMSGLLCTKVLFGHSKFYTFHSQ